MSLSESEFTEIRDRMAANARAGQIDVGKVLRDALRSTETIPAKRSKYGNVKKCVEGITFDSSAEARRYIELKAMQAAGQITNLELQPRYLLLEKFTDISGKTHRAITYSPDFRYLRDGQTVAEDTKGHPSEAFKLRWKMVIQKYPHVRFELSR